ncbi:TonB family protein [Halothiobacillus sp. DCM-1]|uniref:energy transducer TonB n=1 Tax=Halothiobacillus sp. DCM-1 TaxID=3112558 RepID=UPI003252A4E3
MKSKEIKNKKLDFPLRPPWDSQVLIFCLVLGLHGFALRALLEQEAVPPHPVTAPVPTLMGELISVAKAAPTEPEPTNTPPSNAPDIATVEDEPQTPPEPKPLPEPSVEKLLEEKPPEAEAQPTTPQETTHQSKIRTPEKKPKVPHHKIHKTAKPKPQAPLEQTESKTPPTDSVVKNSDPAPAQSAPASPAPVQQTAPVVEPRLDARAGNNPPPDYPRAARMRGEEGTVVLSLLIDSKGNVVDVSIHRSSGYPQLDQSAIRAVRNWHFYPASQGGVAIQWRYLQPITFSLTS